MRIFTYPAFIALFTSATLGMQAQLVIDTDDVDATTLSENLVGGGVTILSSTLVCPDGAAAFFANGETTNMGLSEGILLSTGQPLDAIGPNSSGSTTTNWGEAGDSDLADLVSPFPTFDACYLEIELIPSGDMVEFNYVFASEEYNEYVCSVFNDVFAFFVNGPGAENINIAVLPDVDTPVSINTVNNGSIGSNGNPDNCSEDDLSNSSYFVDNTGGATIEYDGFTVPLTATLEVTPGATYTFKLVIADVGDGTLDSGVFVEAQSFVSPSCVVDGGVISTESPTSFCKSDEGIDATVVVELEEAEGPESRYVVALENGEIVLTSESASIDLGGLPGNGTCFIYHLSWEGELAGLEEGGSIDELVGDCFSLSNALSVDHWFTNGGVISTEQPTSVCIEEDYFIDVNVSNAAGALGQTVTWVITDADLTILDLESQPPFTFNVPGTYLIWRLGSIGNLVGAELGANAGDLSGTCFHFSNPIEVTAEACAPPECAANGGVLSTASPLSYCKTDEEAENLLALELDGAEGDQGSFVVTWQNNGQIFLMADDPAFDMSLIPANGICEFWHVSWSGEIEGLQIGGSIEEISGECFDLSNAIPIVEMAANGGTLAASGNATPCVESGEGVHVQVTQSGGAFGQNIAWVITDEELDIVALPVSPPFAFDSPGTYLIWRLGYAGTLAGAEIGENAGDLSGDCFDLSNPVEVNAVSCTAGASMAEGAAPEDGQQNQTQLTSFPSPTTGASQVEFTTATGGQASLEVYDLSGRLIETLLRREARAGERYQTFYDGSNLPEGIYILRLTTLREVKVAKFVIAR